MSTTLPRFADSGPIDASVRHPVSCLLAHSLGWLAVGGLLTLVHTTQLHSPTFLAQYAWTTFGRLQAAGETALVYGWAANAGFAVALWLLARLGGGPIRGGSIALIGALFWNLGVLLGVGGICAGDLTSFPLLQAPTYAQPLLLVASAALGTVAVLAWRDRETGPAYASHGYAVAAALVFPWVYSAAQALLFWTPVRGVMAPLVAAWAGQNLLGVWLAALVLAAAYYLVPKITGRTLPLYGLAAGAFWTLLVFAPWTGGRLFSDGPVPIWVSAVGILASCMLLPHFLLVGVNLHAAWLNPTRSSALRFVALGLTAYLVWGGLGAVLALRDVAYVAQLTYLGEAHVALLVWGAVTMTFFGAIYFLVPRLTGKPWAVEGLIRLHFQAAAAGLGLMLAGLAGAGIAQAGGLADATVPYAAITEASRPWLLLETGGIALQLLGGIFLAVNLALQLRPAGPGGVAAVNPPSAP